MAELADPLDRSARGAVRIQRLVELHRRKAVLELQIRQETVALVQDDTAFQDRPFVPDELSLLLAESPGTCRRWVEDAQVFVAHARVMALVDDGTWSIRHADAVLDELAGARSDVQEKVLELVLSQRDARTPFQLRKATRAARLLQDLESASDKQDEIHARRQVRVVDELDGSATVLVNGTKTGAAALLAAIDAHVAVPPAGDTRSLDERRYDWLMDLVCGRTSPTEPWQGLIVVSLETLEGGEVPAEIPGLGLVTAAEAREVLASASLRRAVVDEHGVLVALDDQLHTPDQQPLGDRCVEEPVFADEEPPADLGIEEPPTPVDEESLASQGQDEALPESELLVLARRGLSRLEDYLREAILAHAGAGSRPLVQFDMGPPPEPDDDPGGGEPPGGTPRPGPHRPRGDGGRNDTTRPDPDPPERDPDPEPAPTWAERDWLTVQEDTAGALDLLDALAHVQSRSVLRQAVPPLLAPSVRAQQRRAQRLERQARASRWTTSGLQAVVTDLRSAAPSPIPVASKGYPFRGRLARWIKARDVTCTFPGCTLLAQRCQTDHVVAWPKGATSSCNGASECVHHHQAKHAIMTVTRLDDGTLRWQPPRGPAVDRPPRPLLRGW